MKSKRVRWICPECLKGKNGPLKPKMNATIRYCLSCSKKSKFLVERLCPSIEKDRQNKKDRSIKKREKEVCAILEKRTFDGVDVIEEIKKQCKILCHKNIWPKWMKKGVKCIIHKSKYKQRATGLCYYTHITLTLGSEVESETVRELIFHELTHCACKSGVGHSDLFRAKLVEGAFELWGISIEQGPGRVYDLDRLIVERLKDQEKPQQISP